MEDKKKYRDQLLTILPKVHHEPTEYNDERLEAALDKLYRKVTSKMGRALGLEKKIKRYIEQYPHIPTFKNYLAMYYKNKGNHSKYLATIEETEKKHPDYIFAKINRVQILLENEQLDKIPDILGHEFDLHSLYPQKKSFHYTEVLNYSSIVIQYFCKKHEYDMASTHLSLMKAVDPYDERINLMKKTITFSRMHYNMSAMSKQLENSVKYESKNNFKLESTNKSPILENEILNELYKKNLDEFPDALIYTILTLPEESLQEDLKKIIYDSISRFKWFAEENIPWSESTHNFMVHALRFLTELNKPKNLEILLNLMRQDDEFMEYWLSDYMEDFLLPPLYTLGKNSLDILFDYIIEPYNYSSSRGLICNMVCQIAHHEEDRKQEVLQWFKKLINYLIENKNQEGLISSDFIDSIIHHVSNLRATEILPDIERFDELGWIVPVFQGDIEQIKREFNKLYDLHDKVPFPKDIYEAYSGIYLERRAEINMDLHKADFDKIDDDDVLENLSYLLNPNAENESAPIERPYLYPELDNDSDYHEYQPVETVKRSQPKVGRNEPCPCGSGKKYKKCCLNK